jgi:hypothetical protein
MAAAISPLNQNMILSVRGGAGPLDATSTAKTFSSMLAAQSTFSFLGGEPGKDIWDMPDDKAFDNGMYLVCPLQPCRSFLFVYKALTYDIMMHIINKGHHWSNRSNRSYILLQVVL